MDSHFPGQQAMLQDLLVPSYLRVFAPSWPYNRRQEPPSSQQDYYVIGAKEAEAFHAPSGRRALLGELAKSEVLAQSVSSTQLWQQLGFLVVRESFLSKAPPFWTLTY